jgi:hypothetical protein
MLIPEKPKKLNRWTDWLTQNTKLKKDNIWSFGLPPIKTCPQAGECKKYCYGCKGNYRRFPKIADALQKRFEQLSWNNWAGLMSMEIRSRKCKIVRIHSTGDFFEWWYLSNWAKVARENEDVLFYCYTKSVKLFKEVHPNMLPANFRVIFSYGGLQDALIDPTKDRHCKIFNTLEELEQAGYVDVSKSDLVAATTDSLKIGIVKH